MKRKIILSLMGVATAGIVAYGSSRMQTFETQGKPQGVGNCNQPIEALNHDDCSTTGTGEQCQLATSNVDAYYVSNCAIPLRRAE